MLETFVTPMVRRIGELVARIDTDMGSRTTVRFGNVLIADNAARAA